MSEIKISESSLKSSNIIYISQALKGVITEVNGKAEIKRDRNRCEYKITVPNDYRDLTLLEVQDKIADVIAVNYKYVYFKKNIKVTGLTASEYELLLTALISADIDEDKRYAIKKLKSFSEYAIDGIFNFRMQPLKGKWQEILSYIPTVFPFGGLKDFVSYLIKDKAGKRVYYENGKVYDKRFNELNRKTLLGDNNFEYGSIKEMLLSGAGEIELSTKLNDNEEKYLKEFYGDRAIFHEGYFNL